MSFKKWFGGVKEFINNEHGGAAVIYGALSLSLFMVAGIAVDYTRAHYVKKELARALDAAVIAAGSLATDDEDAMTEVAQKYFNANLSQRIINTYDPQIALEFDNGEITGRSSANVQTTLMKVANYNDMNVRSSSTAMQGLVNVEIALVLDNTGSMNSGGKIGALRDAANQLVTTLYTLPRSDEFVKFALVPFSGAVNVNDGVVPGFVDEEGQSQLSREDYPASGQPYWDGGADDNMTGFEALDRYNADWRGCVRERSITVDGEDLDLSDYAPDATNPDTLFPAFIYPLRGHAQVSPNMTEATKRNILETGGFCPPTSVLPLTNDQDELHDRIDAMTGSGGTNIPVGLAWGRRVLSPGAPYTEGVPFSDRSTTKIIILLTDGENWMGNFTSSLTTTRYNAYGLPVYGHLGTSGPLANQLDTKLEALCEDVKGQNVFIYAIGFQLNDPNTQDLMRNCATRPDMYFNSPTNQALQDAFEEIAQGLQELRLTH